MKIALFTMAFAAVLTELAACYAEVGADSHRRRYLSFAVFFGVIGIGSAGLHAVDRWVLG